MKIVLIGSSGQLGRSIIKYAPKNIDLITPDRFQLDLNKRKECYEYILDISPDWVINSGAYTNVDKAELEQELAFEINAKGPESIAKAVSKIGGKLLQISTDYVFDGRQNMPYKVSQNISPINFYGQTKAKGEEFTQKILTDLNQLVIIRTSWLMSPYGNNFATKMLKLLGERDVVNVVFDQISSPTTTMSLSKAIWETIKQNEVYSINQSIFPKINHFCNYGIASWYDVAVAIGEIGLQTGLIKKVANIFPIRSSDYGTSTLRPNYSVLESSQIQKIINFHNNHWRKDLSNMFNEFITLKQ